MSRRSRRDDGRGGDGEARLGDLLEHALRGLEVRRQVREVQLRDAFAEIVGPGAASLCHAVSLERGTVCIAISHSALAHQLQLDSVRLIDELNRRMGGDSVRRLRFMPRG